jgi:DNA-binding XRE family transcriptional regulator
MLRAGITQAMLAKRVGVSRPCVHHWYWGICEPNISSLRKIRSVLGCTFEDLIGG